MRMRTFMICAAMVSICALRADGVTGEAGTNAADFLRLDAGAASAAQGGAYAGRSGGIEVFAYNPAGIARAEKTEVMFQHNSHLLDVTHEYLAAVTRVRRWSIAGSISYLDGGEQKRRTISNPGGVGLPVFNNDAYVAALGIAFGFTDEFSLGATGKIFQENLDTAKREGAAMDLGVHYAPRHSRFEAGAVIRNLGPQVTFDAASEALPLEIALGASAPFWRERAKVSAEISWPRNQDLDYRLGVDVRPISFLSLRAGYTSRYDVGNGSSAGFGVHISNITFDYAWVDYGVTGAAHRAALTAAF